MDWGSPARTYAHTHAVVTHVLIYLESLLGAGFSKVNETAVVFRKHKIQKSRTVPAYPPDMLQLPLSSGNKVSAR